MQEQPFPANTHAHTTLDSYNIIRTLYAYALVIESHKYTQHIQEFYQHNMHSLTHTYTLS